MSSVDSENQNRRLLDEFEQHTYEQWKEAAVNLLNGAPFEKLLITKTYEGFSLDPIYMRKDVESLPQVQDFPGFGSRARGARASGYNSRSWEISQEIAESTPERFNAVARKELENGQTELNVWFDLPTRCGWQDSGAGWGVAGVCGFSMMDRTAFAQAFEGIHLDYVSIYLRSGLAAGPLASLFFAYLQEKGIGVKNLRGSIDCDPIGWLVETGELPGGLAARYDEMAALASYCIEEAPGFQCVSVQGHAYHNAGGASYQELGLVMSTAVAYLRALSERGIDLNKVAPRFRISLTVGPNFFLEIAKLRAARMLWSRITEAFGIEPQNRTFHLHARTGLWNKTSLDAYTNILRVTTEAFSAVVGGCDSLHIGAFDEVFREVGDFSRRVSRNIHHILGEECDLAQVIDPAGGSYAVEVLTDRLYRAAWSYFQELEGAGGMPKVLEEGLPQKQIAAVREEKLQNIARRKDSIVGINNYPNVTEKIAVENGTGGESGELKTTPSGVGGGQAVDLTELRKASGSARMEAAVVAALEGASLAALTEAWGATGEALRCEALKIMRASEPYENLRRAAAAFALRTGTAPSILQLNMGPSRRYRARADWTSAFFTVGGLLTLSDQDFESVDEAVARAAQSRAPFAVITSDDENYTEVVPELARKLKELVPGLHLLLAGAPGENESLWRDAGVDDFVHIRVNCYDMNRSLLARLGAVE